MNRIKKQAQENTRRHFLRSSLLLSGALLPLPFILRNKILQSATASQGSLGGFNMNDPSRFLQIMLAGGWDSALATDPIVGSKQADGVRYAKEYEAVGSVTVTGKPNLRIGAGLLPAAGAFAEVPTCFVNGLFVEVTAHELAVNFALSGRLSLSRSREYPAIIALMGDRSGVFPPHVTLGGQIPLGSTRETNPPLHASDMSTIKAMLSGPRSKFSENEPILSDPAIAVTDALIARLNELRYSAEQRSSSTNLRVWSQAESRLTEFYAARYDQSIGLPANAAIRQRYGLPATGAEWELEALMAGAFQVLQSGLCPYVTVAAGGFDTHRSHLQTHLPLMQKFSTALKQLITDLQNTPDPAKPQLKLAQTTTILITSEFVRTPLFNGAQGTDHWQSGSAILLGKGVNDNSVIGLTDSYGKAMGWQNGAAVDPAPGAMITPENLGAALLEKFGFGEEAQTIGAEPLAGVFSA